MPPNMKHIMPCNFMYIDILPIVKNKGGDTTDMNNIVQYLFLTWILKYWKKLFWIELLGILTMTNISLVLKQVIPQR